MTKQRKKKQQKKRQNGKPNNRGKQVQSIRRVPLKKRKITKRKLRFGRIFLTFLGLILLGVVGKKIVSFPITAIYISGNTILSDQEIIELAHLEQYPAYFGILKRETEDTLETNIYIKNAKVKKKKWKEIYIEIEENTPLFYDASRGKTILKDGQEIEEVFLVPTLLNYVPDTLYSLLKEKMLLLERDIYTRISEIKYSPNEVDDKRFYLTMVDGNQVYVTLKRFEKINSYVEIMKEILVKYENKKGILYLDEGEYFELREE